MLAAAFGIPGAGATKGTVVNINAGGKTESQEQFMAYFLLAVLFRFRFISSVYPTICFAH
jgi:SulP family sulfate permease